jgi:TRAP-type C4-dicarboxylate transport system substrate-binding protein
MKKLTHFLVAATCLCVIGSVSPANLFGAEPVVLKAGGAWPQTSPFAEMYFKYFDLVKEKSKGQLQIKWVGGPEYIKEKDLPSSAATGAIDLFHTSLGYHSGQVPEAAIADSYPTYRSYKSEPEAYFEVRNIMAPVFEKTLKAKTLGEIQVFPFFVFIKKSISKIEEFKGLKIRAAGGFAPYVVNALGAVPTTTPTTEVYMALERGVIDGAVRNLPALNTFREFEFAKFGIAHPVTWATGEVCISLRAWNKLSKEMQNALLDAGKEITKMAAVHWEKMDQILMKKFPEQKMTFWDPPEGMKKTMTETIQKSALEDARKLSPKLADSMIAAFEKAYKKAGR